MKKTLRSDSLVTKAVIMLLICSAVFMLAAMPLTKQMTFDTFYPYMVEYLTNRAGDSAARMSRFLGFSNPHMYGLTLSDEFKAAVRDYDGGRLSAGELRELTEPILEPYEITIDFSEDFNYSCTCYPAVYIDNCGVIRGGGWDGAAVDNLIASDWFADYRENHFGRYVYSPQFKGQDGSAYLGYVYSAWGGEDEAETDPYYSVLMFRVSDLQPLWQEIIDLGVEDYALIDQDYSILYNSVPSSNIDLNWIKSELTSDRQHHVVTKFSENQAYYSVLVSYRQEGLRFVMQVPRSVFHNMFKSSLTLVQVSYLVMLFILITVMLAMLIKIFRRLKDLSDKMELVRGGDYSVRAEEEPRDEIGRLGASFNAMTGKIQDNVNMLVEKEQREKLLQYNLMVSAIDPHFINNTLNTSTRLAELGRTDDVVAVNDALINFLKDNLKMKSYQTFDTVENELNALKQYIIIQNYLCDNTVEIQYDVSPRDMEMKIPKFLLQPLVENAILHGIVMNVDENGQYIGGIIHVSVSRDEDYVYISVKDNGVGMDADTVKRYFIDRQEDVGEAIHEHIGVMNMRIRLSHLYGDDWRMNVTSEPGKGTEVVIRLRRFE